MYVLKQVLGFYGSRVLQSLPEDAAFSLLVMSSCCCASSLSADGSDEDPRAVPQNKKAIERLAAYGLSLCPGPTSRPTLQPRRPTPVSLNIYDIVATSTNATLSRVGCGIYHTGVVVHNLEWSYGEAAEMGTETGLFVVNPGSACGTLFTTLLAGETDLSAEQIDTLLHRMENEWRSEDYHLLHNNCNHFAEYFCALLTTNRSKPLRVPKWCNRAARVADCFVPQALATYVLRKMDGAEEPPKARTKVESNVADLPTSVIPRGWYLRVPSIVDEPRFQIVPTHALGHMLSPQRAVSRFSTQWKVQGDAEQAGGKDPAPAFSGILLPTAPATATAAPAPSEGHGGKDPPAHRKAAASANTRCEASETIGLKHCKASSTFFAPPPPGRAITATHEKDNSVLIESSSRDAAVLDKSGAARFGMQQQQDWPLGPSVGFAKLRVTPLAASADFSIHLHSSSDDVELPSPLHDQPNSAPVNPKTLSGDNDGVVDPDVYSDPEQQADQDEVLQHSCSEVFIPGGGGMESDDTSRGGNDASPLRDSLRMRSLDNTTTDERPVPLRQQLPGNARCRGPEDDGRTADDEDDGGRRSSPALATADNDATVQTFPADDDDVSPPRDRRGLLSRRGGSRSLAFTLNDGTGAANTKNNSLAANVNPSSSNNAALADDQTSMRLQDEAQESPTAVDTVQHDVSAMQTISRHMMNSDEDEDDSAEVDDSSTHQTEDRTVFTESAAAVAAAATPAPGGAPLGRYARQGGVGGATAAAAHTQPARPGEAVPRQPAAGEVDGSPIRPVRQLVQQYDSPE
jgi:hypothetical protein